MFKSLIGYAVANGLITVSPAAQLTAAIKEAPPQARERVLTDDEIRFMMTTDLPVGADLRFLLATGLRLGEGDQRREGQYWVVPATLSNNGREHRVCRPGAARGRSRGRRCSTG